MVKMENDWHHLPSLFTHFDLVTKLALRYNWKSITIDVEALVLILIQC